MSTAAIDAPDVTRAERRSVEGRRLEGSYAGAVSRLVGYVIDVWFVSFSFAVATAVVAYVISNVFPVDIDPGELPIASGVALAVWTYAYFTYLLATSGRTVGKAIVGTRVVRADGSKLGLWRAALRVAAMPLSFALFGLGLLLIVVRADRRALHDLIAGSAEVYSWSRGRRARHR